MSKSTIEHVANTFDNRKIGHIPLYLPLKKKVEGGGGGEEEAEKICNSPLYVRATRISKLWLHN